MKCFYSKDVSLTAISEENTSFDLFLSLKYDVGYAYVWLMSMHSLVGLVSLSLGLSLRL